MLQSICHSFRHLYPPVRVRLCLLCLVRHLPALRHKVLSSHRRLIGMRNPFSPTITRIVTPSTLTVAQHWGGLLYESLIENQNHAPQNERTKIATGLAKKDHNKNCDRSKKSDSRCVTEWSCGHSPLCKDHEGDHTSNGKCERSRGQESPSNRRKNKQRHRRSTSPSRNRKKSRTPEG